MLDKSRLVETDRKERHGAVESIKVTLLYFNYWVDIKKIYDEISVDFVCTDGIGPCIDIFSLEDGFITFKLSDISPRIKLEEVDTFSEDLNVCKDLAEFIRDNLDSILAGDYRK